MKQAIAAAMLLAAASPRAFADAPPVCIQSTRIDHTDVVDDSTILFTMNDRTVYRNVMPHRCYGLHLETRGFSYEPTPGSYELCSNLETIRLNTDGNICMLGAFEKLPLHKR